MIRIGIAACLLGLAWVPAQAAEHTVTVGDNFFDPKNLTIEPGDTVIWTNKGIAAHNVDADDGSFRCAEGCDNDGQPGNGNPSSAGWTVERTFDAPGEIPYHCDAHGSAGGFGMAGTITVKQSDDEGIPINFGHTGSWFNPETGGQGFLVEVVPEPVQQEEPLLVAYWFTFARGEPGGVNRQRWFQAQGTIEGSTAELDRVLQVTGGVFDEAGNVSDIDIGHVTLEFASCTEATLTYSLDLNGDGMEETTGEIALTRLTPDVVCEEMTSSGG